MPLSIFHAALKRALLRHPLTFALLSQLNSTLVLGEPKSSHEKYLVRVGVCKNAFNSSYACSVHSRASSPSQKKPETEKKLAKEGSVKEEAVEDKKSAKEKKPVKGKPAKEKKSNKNSIRKQHPNITRPELLPILRSIGRAKDIPVSKPGKTNLSYSDPLLPRSVRGRANQPWRFKSEEEVRKDEDQWEENLESSSTWTESSKGPLSLRIITERYIRTVYRKHKHSSISFRHSDEAPSDADLDAIKTVFTPSVLEYLHKKGCKPEDVLVWTWILFAPNSHKSFLRLELGTLVKDGKDSLSYRIPPFLMLYTLRRNPIHHFTLRSLLPIIRYMLSPHALIPIIDQKSVLLLLIRLLRRTREYWATGILQVAKVLVSHFNPVSESTQSEPPSSRLTHTYNRILMLLSRPPSDRPFKFVPLLQKSQFLLLRKMAAVGAPITREGYQAIITVQLAHSKSEVEKDAVRNMSTNWPPWPVEKHGWQEIHRHAFEKVISRAGGVIRQMMEAGYGLKRWEEEAMVLAGSDTDDSPTIQTRSFWTVRRNRKNEEEGIIIWAARIRATRTTEEAWSIFLACREELSRIPAREIWEEMFEKLIARKRFEKCAEMERIKLGIDALEAKEGTLQYYQRKFLIRKLRKRKYNTVPGDGKEVIPPPRNPSEGVYIPVPLPSIGELFTMMKRDGVAPSVRIITLLVREVEEFPEAEWILKTWRKEYYDYITNPSDPGIPAHIIKVGMNNCTLPKVLTAYLYTLRKFHRLNEAIELLLKHTPIYPPAWNMALAGVVKALSSKEEGRRHRILCLMLVWRLYREMVKHVPEDTVTLKTLAGAGERCILYGLENEVSWDGEPIVDRIIRVFQKGLSMDPVHLSLDFSLDFRPSTPPSSPFFEDQSENLPPATAPAPSTLHSYIRMLGFARKYCEILQLSRWMQVHQQEIDLEGEMGRRVIVAMRVFLEGLKHEGVDEKVEEGGLEGEMEGGIEGEVREVEKDDKAEAVRSWAQDQDKRRRVVVVLRKEMENWVEWPQEEEVEEYRVLGGLS